MRCRDHSCHPYSRPPPGHGGRTFCPCFSVGSAPQFCHRLPSLLTYWSKNRARPENPAVVPAAKPSQRERDGIKPARPQKPGVGRSRVLAPRPAIIIFILLAHFLPRRSTPSRERGGDGEKRRTARPDVQSSTDDQRVQSATKRESPRLLLRIKIRMKKSCAEIRSIRQQQQQRRQPGRRRHGPALVPTVDGRWWWLVRRSWRNAGKCRGGVLYGTVSTRVPGVVPPRSAEGRRERRMLGGKSVGGWGGGQRKAGAFSPVSAHRPPPLR